MAPNYEDDQRDKATMSPTIPASLSIKVHAPSTVGKEDQPQEVVDSAEILR
jgi:hypothetical protein